MSSRQIKRLQKLNKSEDSDVEIPQKLTPYNKLPKYSFNLLADDRDSSESSSSEDEQVNELKNNNKHKDSTSNSKEQVSEESDWEELLNQVEQNNSVDDDQPDVEFKHFLSSPVHYFKTRDHLEHGGNKYSKKSVFHSASRYWLSPGLGTKESMQLRTLASKQIDVQVESDPDTGRDVFEIVLTDFYREIDDICSSASHSQDFDLFKNLMQTNPFHLGILIRASCINTISSNHQEAFNHLDLAVKILQTVLPHRFSLYRKNSANLPNVWLPSDRGDNLLIYRLLLLYMISLERKGQWHTSLAVCKLLMAMDFPEDVSHALLHVDMYLLNCFEHTNSISNFVYSYYDLMDHKFPPMFWYLPNFAFTLSLQLYLNLKRPVANLMNDYEVVRDYLMPLLCLQDENDGFTFKPKLDLKSHLELIECMGDYAPYLYLLRALIQYPLFLVKMSERSGSSPEIRSCLSEYPFNSAKESENEEYEHIDHQLVRCYTYKCGDLWSGSSSTFLSQTANLLIQMYRDEDDRYIIESFQALWSAHLMDIEFPDQLNTITVTEFDLANYSLPRDLETPI